MSAQSTPGPWRFEPWPHERECMGAELGALAIIGANRICPAVVWGGITETESNAQLIVTAVNCHADLLAALKVTAGNIRSLGPAGAIPVPYEAWLRVVDAAIEKAERTS